MSDDEEERGSSVQVVCRVPDSVSHNGKTFVLSRDLQSFRSRRNEPGNGQSFTFDRIFGHDQLSFFHTCMQPILQVASQGHNSVVICAGPQHSGKTFTLEGNTQTGEFSGIIPCSVDLLLNHKRLDSPPLELRIRCVAIVGDQTIDLLGHTENRRSSSLSPNPNGVAYLNGLAVREIHSRIEMIDALKQARATLNAKHHPQSQSAHIVYTLIIKAVLPGQNSYSSRIAFVRLAATEYSNTTVPVKQGGSAFEGLGSSSTVSKSLAAISQVIQQVHKRAAHTAYRDSKLTYYLKDTLTPNSLCLYIAHVSPNPESYSANLSTMRYARRLRETFRPRAMRERYPVPSIEEHPSHISPSINENSTEVKHDHEPEKPSKHDETVSEFPYAPPARDHERYRHESEEMRRAMLRKHSDMEQLKTECGRIKAELIEAKNSLVETRAQRDNFARQLEAERKTSVLEVGQKEALEDESNHWRLEYSRQKQQLEETIDSLMECRKQMGKLTDDYNNLKLSGEGARLLVETLEKDKIHLKSQVLRIQQESNEKSKRIEEINREIIHPDDKREVVPSEYDAGLHVVTMERDALREDLKRLLNGKISSTSDSAVRVLNTHFATALEEIKLLRNSLAACRKDLRRSFDEKENLTREIISARVFELPPGMTEIQIIHALNEKERTERELNSKTVQLQEKQDDCQQLQLELADCKLEIQELTQKCSQGSEAASMKESSLVYLRKTLENQIEASEALSRELREKSDECRDLHTKLRDASTSQAHSTKVNEELQRFQAENAALRLANQDLKHQCDKMNDQLSQVRQYVSELEMKYSLTRKQNEERTLQLHSASESVAHFKHCLERAGLERDEAIKELAQARAAARDGANHAIEMKYKVQEEGKRREDADAQVQLLKAQVSKLQHENRVLTQNLDRASTQCTELKFNLSLEQQRRANMRDGAREISEQFKSAAVTPVNLGADLESELSMKDWRRVGHYEPYFGSARIASPAKVQEDALHKVNETTFSQETPHTKQTPRNELQTLTRKEGSSNSANVSPIAFEKFKRSNSSTPGGEAGADLKFSDGESTSSSNQVHRPLQFAFAKSDAQVVVQRLQKSRDDIRSIKGANELAAKQLLAAANEFQIMADKFSSNLHT